MRKTGLSIARVLISLIIIKDLLIYLFNYKTLFGSRSIENFGFFVKILKLYHIGFIEPLFRSDPIVLAFLGVCLGTSVLLFLGIFNKPAGIILLAGLILIKFRNIYIMDGGDNLILILLPYIALGESDPLIKVRSLTEQGSLKNIGQNLALLMPLGIICQVCIVYFFAGLIKINGPLWKEGTALYYVMRVDDFRWTPVNIFLTKSSFFVKGLTYLTILWELTFPLWLMNRITKYIVLVVGFFMHIGIVFFMHIDNYSFVMISVYFVFLTDQEYENIKAWWQSRSKDPLLTARENKTELVLFFDSECLLCNRFVQLLIKLDSKSRFNFTSLNSDYAKTHLPLDHQGGDSMVLRTGTQLFRKADAFINIFKEIGGYYQLVRLLYIFPFPLRNKIYDLIAKDRHKILGNNDQCLVPDFSLNNRFYK